MSSINRILREAATATSSLASEWPPVNNHIISHQFFGKKIIFFFFKSPNRPRKNPDVDSRCRIPSAIHHPSGYGSTSIDVGDARRPGLQRRQRRARLQQSHSAAGRSRRSSGRPDESVNYIKRRRRPSDHLRPQEAQEDFLRHRRLAQKGR